MKKTGTAPRSTNKSRIGSSESTTLEWKPSLSQIHEIIESITAFANTDGGRLLIGVSKIGEPVGVSIGKDTIESLANRIAQHTEPKMHPHIDVVTVQGKEIIIIDVKKAHEKPVLADGKSYTRVGRATRQMGKDEYESHILDKHKEKLRFDIQVCKGATIKDIRPGLVREFIGTAKAERGLDLSARIPVKEALMRFNLMSGSKLTNAAVLLFGSPEKYFTQCEIKCVRFKGLDVTGEMLDLKPIGGSVIEQLRDAEKFIFDHIAMAAWIESRKLQRQEKWEYPPKAIREALANAIAHRDYWSTGKVQVRIFDDRIEFWNPGVLPKGWTVETLKKKHDSKPFNPLIARAFFWIKYIEEMGTGTNKIVQWCREWGLPNPDFEYTAGSIVVTIKKALSKTEKPKGKVEGEQLAEGLVEGLVERLVENQRKMLDLIKANPYVSKKELADRIGISTTAIDKNVNQLKKKGLLSRIGPDKGGYWEVRK